MTELDEEKLARLKRSADHLTEKYGAPGTPSREAFEARAMAYYRGATRRGRRKGNKHHKKDTRK